MQGYDELIENIDTLLFPKEYNVSYLLPYSAGGIYNILKEKTTVLDTQYQNDGIYVRAIVNVYYYNLYQEYLTSSKEETSIPSLDK